MGTQAMMNVVEKKIAEAWPRVYALSSSILVAYKPILATYTKLFSWLAWEEELILTQLDSASPADVVKALTTRRYVLEHFGADRDLFLFAESLEGYFTVKLKELHNRLEFAYVMSSVAALLPLGNPLTHVDADALMLNEAVQAEIEGFGEAQEIVKRELKKFIVACKEYVEMAETALYCRDGCQKRKDRFEAEMVSLRTGIPTNLPSDDDAYVRVVIHKESIESVRAERLCRSVKAQKRGSVPVKSTHKSVSASKSSDRKKTEMEIGSLGQQELAVLQRTHSSMEIYTPPQTEGTLLVNPEVAMDIDDKVEMKLHPEVIKEIQSDESTRKATPAMLYPPAAWLEHHFSYATRPGELRAHPHPDDDTLQMWPPMRSEVFPETPSVCQAVPGGPLGRLGESGQPVQRSIATQTVRLLGGPGYFQLDSEEEQSDNDHNAKQVVETAIQPETTDVLETEIQPANNVLETETTNAVTVEQVVPSEPQAEQQQISVPNVESTALDIRYRELTHYGTRWHAFVHKFIVLPMSWVLIPILERYAVNGDNPYRVKESRRKI